MDLSFFLILILSIIPSLFWLRIYLREDRRDPEPPRLILKLFIAGIIAGALSLGAEFIFLYFFKGGYASFFSGGLSEDLFIAVKSLGENNFWESFIVFVLAAPFIEEFFKYAAVKKFAFNARSFNQAVDGVIYAVSAALGFAMFENFIYFAGFLSKGTYFLAGGFITRTFLSTLLHSLSAGWLGYWIGKARFAESGRTKFLAIGFVSAAAIHSAFNFFMTYNMVLLAIFTLAVLFDLLFVRLRSRELQAMREWVPAKHILKIFKK
jgi:protease PrsW